MPSREEILALREKYPVGTKIRLKKMNDIQAVKPGTIGKVTHVDDMGNIHMSWETGSSLGLIEGEDEFVVIK